MGRGAACRARTGRLCLAVFACTLALPASASAGVELIGDGGFEGGTPNSTWTESSTNFTTPLCTSGTCSGPGSGARSGSVWARFGGIDANETASLSQLVTIPAGTADLSFFLEIPSCDAAGTDTFVVKVDTTAVFSANNSAAACGSTGYLQKDVALDAYADGGAHAIEFRGEISGEGTGTTSFMLDDVSLLSLAYSSTALSLAKTESYIETYGYVTPLHSGIRMRLILSQDTGSGFVRLATERAFLDGAGEFIGAFARPAGGGRCKVRALFPGDDDHLPSSDVARTKC